MKTYDDIPAFNKTIQILFWRIIRAVAVMMIIRIPVCAVEPSVSSSFWESPVVVGQLIPVPRDDLDQSQKRGVAQQPSVTGSFPEKDESWLHRHGQILVSLKYATLLGPYVDSKILIGKIDPGHPEFGSFGIGYLLDGGVGTHGYKIGGGIGGASGLRQRKKHFC
jgi:hypothetical protein